LRCGSSVFAMFQPCILIGSVCAVVDAPAGEEPVHGIYSLAEILGFIIGLITTEHELAHDDMNVLGLELMYTALNAGRTGALTALPRG
jgi:hypothetical protein